MNKIKGQADTASPDSHKSAEPKIRLKGGKLILGNEINPFPWPLPQNAEEAGTHALLSFDGELSESSAQRIVRIVYNAIAYEGLEAMKRCKS